MEFISGNWQRHINVRDFIIRNYTPYDGDDSFLATPTEKTQRLWDKVKELMNEERNNGGVLDIDDKTISTITAHAPGFIDKELEDIVGLQTDAPLKRAIMPYGGIRMVRTSLAAYNRTLSPEIERISRHRKTHNDGVFDAYTEDMKKARRTGIITGLPDSYGRGRIIGDYRRIALYGVDYLLEQKNEAKDRFVFDIMNEAVIGQREELS